MGERFDTHGEACLAIPYAAEWELHRVDGRVDARWWFAAVPQEHYASAVCALLVWLADPERFA